jgi:ectoine hydroxylase-related dioxygenase (phytanoyl-CoA dioxygenase family)
MKTAPTKSKTTEQHAKEIREQGYTIIESGVAPEALQGARKALDEIFENEKDIGPERGWHNDSYKIPYMLPQKHRFFRNLYLNDKLLPVMREVLGSNCCLAALNGLTMTPAGKTQALHIDQNETVPGNVMYINALHALDDWKKVNGCTRIIPGSQNRH